MTPRPIIAATALVMMAATPALCDEAPFRASQSEVDAFVRADLDKDIRISAQEFKPFIRALAAQGQSTAQLIRFFGAYKYAFSIADADKDGVLSPEELRAANNTHKAN